MGEVVWLQTGNHNTYNAIAAIAAARNIGVTPAIAIAALCQFEGVKRRMENLGTVHGITVYDDFAHHPTAIATTLEGLRAQVGNDKIIALIEPRSNTMRMGIHKQQLANACRAADAVLWYQPEHVDWNLSDVVNNSPITARLHTSINGMITDTIATAKPIQSDADRTHVVIMSNGGFAGIHSQLLDQLKLTYP